MTQAIARLDLPAQTVASTSGKAREMLETSQQRLGFVPNMYANMVNSPGVLQTYLLGYELFRNEGGFTPAEQEVVFLSVSRFNGCTYCMAAHSMIGDKMSKVPADSLAALREGKPLPDAKLQALATFSTIMVESRGTPTPEQLAAFKAAGYTDRHALEIVLAIAVKTLSNYSNHVFHTQTDPAFQAYAWNPQA
ncbi:MAG: carboxymuconolactone decarboxylase family protein [Betaproteobacteria bacterium]|nr:carboxymuconolactone decarboxylase family protein [Betaproteobacteria bacterium]MDE2154189.1 carboxymuconolactone decarboxylase family protein [Betaproteobacteria bacterium]MDE2478596.1 carboxymuconolactone decarboxylase family protein [Betaproteobacteria bacterium]